MKNYYKWKEEIIITTRNQIIKTITNTIITNKIANKIANQITKTITNTIITNTIITNITLNQIRKTGTIQRCIQKRIQKRR